MTDATPDLILTLGAFALATFNVLLFDAADRLPQFRKVAVFGLALLGIVPGIGAVIGALILVLRSPATPMMWTLLSSGLLLEVTASVLMGKLRRRS
jgi:hypothetical protein